MKLKNILIPFAGVLLLTACEKDHRNDNLTDPRVYIVNNGVQNAIYYDVEETILHRGAAVAAQFAADYLAETAQQ